MEYEKRNREKEAKEAKVYKLACEMKQADPNEFKAVNLTDTQAK